MADAKTGTYIKISVEPEYKVIKQVNIKTTDDKITTSRGDFMLVSTTPLLDGRQVTDYYGLVSGEAILGANIFKDIFASIRDIVGGRSAAYEKELRRAKKIAVEEMCAEAERLGANAVIGVDLDYETIGSGGGNMLMVSASGTAVKYN